MQVHEVHVTNVENKGKDGRYVPELNVWVYEKQPSLEGYLCNAGINCEIKDWPWQQIETHMVRQGVLKLSDCKS